MKKSNEGFIEMRLTNQQEKHRRNEGLPRMLKLLKILFLPADSLRPNIEK